MHRLAVNFASEQRSLIAWHPLLGLTLLFLGISTLAAAVLDYRQQTEERSTLMKRLDSARQGIRGMHNDSVTIPADLIAKVEQVNTAYALIKAPWEEILHALETARDAGKGNIALLSIKADAAKRQITLTGEARDFAVLNSFTSVLSVYPLFQNVTLVNDKLSDSGTPVVVAFELHLDWRDSGVAIH